MNKNQNQVTALNAFLCFWKVVYFLGQSLSDCFKPTTLIEFQDRVKRKVPQSSAHKCHITKIIEV